MRRKLVCAIASALWAIAAMTNGGAFAAPPVLATQTIVPIYNWTGFYVGGNAGYSWGHVGTTLSITEPPFPDCHFCGPGGNFPIDIANIESAGSPAFDPKGFTGGGQIGYNWQVSSWVFGVEVDYESFRLKATNSTSTVLPQLTAFPACVGSCVANLATSVSTNWLFTARPRVGYAWNQTLIYATGGIAITKVTFAQSYSDNIVVGEGNGFESASASKRLVGWTVGAGFEQALTNHLSVKAEYLFTDFGGLNAAGVLHDSIPTDFSIFTNTIGRLTASTMRGGINYKF
jgi:outer membrane immunogenic protein